MTRHLRTAAATVGALALTLAATSCAGGSDDAPADNGGLRIVASTTTWGDIAQQVIDDAGDTGTDVTVDTVLSGTDDDPHEYEASARDISTIRDADIVVGNGAGYDNWLTDNAGDDAEVITAAPLGEAHDHGDDGDHDHGGEDHAGHDHGSGVLDGGDNPHVWFDMETVAGFANNLAAHLNSIDDSFPAEATGMQETTTEFTDRVAALPHAHVLLTEPVAGLLLKGSEVHDVSPEGFAQAVLNEGEPSVADLSAARDLVTDGEVDALITNTQSESQAATQLTDAADDRDVPVINVNETPDSDETYTGYVDGVISDLEDALD
ncbi:MAG: metal ABC transporter solute-binding protein, Zn/Mn family [Mycobacteriaceae bacterium]|uniref:metal ABC transporter solute-binding protein, Zn/Mn family n=1 Tax=Corynebacterium sp. TaxID=1720 RepID=UPI003F9884BE